VARDPSILNAEAVLIRHGDRGTPRISRLEIYVARQVRRKCIPVVVTESHVLFEVEIKLRIQRNIVITLLAGDIDYYSRHSSPHGFAQRRGAVRNLTGNLAIDQLVENL
jgi:hypothetical protein